MRAKTLFTSLVAAMFVAFALYALSRAGSPGILAQETTPILSPAGRLPESLTGKPWRVQSVTVGGLARPLVLTGDATFDFTERRVITLHVHGCDVSEFSMGAIEPGNAYSVESLSSAPDNCALHFLRDLSTNALLVTNALALDGDRLILRGAEPFVEIELTLDQG